MKLGVIFSILLVFLSASTTSAQEFIELAGIPYVSTGKIDSLGDYVDALYKASISIAAFLAVVKIIFAGVKYMLSDIVPTKEAAKKDIWGALIGLLIVVGAVLILNTINPQLSNLDVLNGDGKLAPIKLDGGGDEGGDTLPPLVKTGDTLLNPSPEDYTKFKEGCNGKTQRSALNGISGFLITCLSSDTELIEQYCPVGKTCHIEKCYNDNLFETKCKNKCLAIGGFYAGNKYKKCITSTVVAPYGGPDETKIRIEGDITYTLFIREGRDPIEVVPYSLSPGGLIAAKISDMSGETIDSYCYNFTPSLCDINNLDSE